MKRWVEDIKGIGDLEYIIFKKIPMRETQWGPAVELSEKIMEQMAARAIIECGLPLRGREVRFLRKCLGLSLHAFAEKLDLSSTAILKWEKLDNDRLHVINEVAVRSFVAEALNVDVSGKCSQLRGTEKTPKVLELKAS